MKLSILRNNLCMLLNELAAADRNSITDEIWERDRDKILEKFGVLETLGGIERG